MDCEKSGSPERKLEKSGSPERKLGKKVGHLKKYLGNTGLK